MLSGDKKGQIAVWDWQKASWSSGSLLFVKGWGQRGLRGVDGPGRCSAAVHWGCDGACAMPCLCLGEHCGRLGLAGCNAVLVQVYERTVYSSINYWWVMPAACTSRAAQRGGRGVGDAQAGQLPSQQGSLEAMPTAAAVTAG